MKYKYPKISNVLTYKRINEDEVKVIDHFTDDSYIFSLDAVRYVRQLDGYTHPYRIPTHFSREEIDQIIEFLEEHFLTRQSDIINVSFGTILKTLWTPKQSLFLKIFAYLSNSLLLLFWLPVFITGLFLFARNIEYINFSWIWVGFFIGLLSGLLFHELGHAFAGLSYGARVFEMGVMIRYCILPGAYVLLDRERVKKRMQRVQVGAAGVEANFMLIGVFLILGAVFPELGGMFMTSAICNAFLGVLNLTLINGLDGISIASELLGIEDLVEQAKEIVFNKKARIKVAKQGVSGYAAITMCYILTVLQAALPVLLITNVLEVIACFM